jgi:hypothetical protein
MRLHRELRRAADGPEPPDNRLEPLELATIIGDEELSRTNSARERVARRSSTSLRILALSMLVGGVSIWWTQYTLHEAAVRAAAAQQQAAAAVARLGQHASPAGAADDTQVADAQFAARRARIVSNVLAAPDLVRFSLPGAAGAPKSSAQVLWSRTRGVVLSGSQLPAPPAGARYQLWLLTRTQPVDAGSFVPDGNGGVTWATDTLPDRGMTVTGAAVTLEPSTGAPQRSTAGVKSRALIASAGSAHLIDPRPQDLGSRASDG